VYQRGERWWIEYWHRGEQYREAAVIVDRAGITRPAKDEKEAHKKLEARRREILGDKFVGPQEERVTVADLVDDLLLHLRTRGAKSVGSFVSHLLPIRAFFALRRAVEVSTPQIERYIEERLKQGKARATVNRETGALRQAFNLAVKRTPPKLTRVPYIPMLKEDNARQGFFERAEFEAVAGQLPAQVADVARFAYLSGWRKGEILPLRWDAVDRQGREVRLRTSKSGKPRTLPLDGDLWDLIDRRWTAREYDRNGTATLSEYVFHAGDGQAIVDFKHSWSTACKRAGLPGRLFHDLRRTAVRDMIRAGVPQSVAMRISGHRTTAIFLRYDIASEADKRDALRKTQAHRATQTTIPTVVPMALASRAR
jgi:integrase